MLRFVLISILLSWSVSAYSEVYRWIDQDGNPVFSDTLPSKSARPKDVKTVKLPPVETIPSVNAPRGSSKQALIKNSKETYTQFSITEPISNAVIRDNTGNIKVSTALDPALQSNDRIRLYLDGAVIADGHQTQFQLANVDRGTHTLHAEVNDAAGTALISTQPTHFTLHRFSILHKPTSPNPINQGGAPQP
jgi:hypothetical protein